MVGSDGPFAVIVADTKMPGMDGVRFLARIKDVSPDIGRRLPDHIRAILLDHMALHEQALQLVAMQANALQGQQQAAAQALMPQPQQPPQK